MTTCACDTRYSAADYYHVLILVYMAVRGPHFSVVYCCSDRAHRVHAVGQQFVRGWMN